METEVNAKINAVKSERTDERSGYRFGYRVRRYDTRLGTMYICSQTKKRWLNSHFCHREKTLRMALLQVIQEAYINGISTRKIEKLAKNLEITLQQVKEKRQNQVA